MAREPAPLRSLRQAIDAGDDEAVDALLAVHPDALNRTALPPQIPPLHAAAYRGRDGIVERLLAAGARADLDAWASVPDRTFLAVHHALYGRHDSTVRLLLDAGSPTDLAVHVGLGDLEAIRAAVEANPSALFHGYGHLGYSALHFAADTGRAAAVPVLCELGLPPDVEDASGHAPLRYAARNEPEIEVLEALVAAGADVNRASPRGHTALAGACRHRRSLPGVRWLLEHGADPDRASVEGVTPLHKAVGNGVAEMVALLLEHGADPDRASRKGETPRELAERKGRKDVLAAFG
jgi:ankyrin repeat protein